MKKINSLFIALLLLICSINKVTAQEHYNLIINQVRGQECCSPGNINHFRSQLSETNKLNLNANFALRYDVLNNPIFIQEIEKYKNDFEWSAFLEITPQLAQDANVPYLGTEETWYEAQYSYLIGYSQENREKIINQYMEKFKDVVGNYPQASTAWMIDNFSLKLLKGKYGIKVHQITREQMGVDSYTLYGGPAHYPYWPSNNWTMIPFTDEEKTNFNSEMPLIVRQTITDPVFNYGDDSSSFTSQPNDYFLRESAGLGKADINYFEHLFSQAHQQDAENWTFTLIGLENSMPQEIQEEYRKQLAIVADWQKNENNFVLKASDFAQIIENKKNNVYFHIYHGKNEKDNDDQAWWITTQNYRIRVRLNDNELYISDLRLYSQEFTDPYFEQEAQQLGWWINPFLIDGSRYFYKDDSRKTDTLAKDFLEDRKNKFLEPTRLTIKKVDSEKIKTERTENSISFFEGELKIAEFSIDSLAFDEKFKLKIKNSLTENTLKDLAWVDHDKNRIWSLKKTKNENNLDVYKIQIDKNPGETLNKERIENYPLLFPEIKNTDLDSKTSYLHKNNRFAIAGRNPVRLVFFPKDQYSYPVNISTEPRIESSQQLDNISVKTQSAFNGMVFLDFENNDPVKSIIIIKKGDFEEKLIIYFAPNCKENPKYCLTHPRQATWFIRSLIGDKVRLLKEKFL